MGPDMHSFMHNNSLFKIRNILAVFSPSILVFIGLIFLISALLRWLWNITIPQIFNLPEITYWQAFRLLIIAGILFGGGLGG